MDYRALMTRIAHADPQRRSRFHTYSGKLVISPDIFPALASTLNRTLFDRHPHLPWLTYPAIRFLEESLHGRRLFEFGSGTSTRWYAERCREVRSTENNASWFEAVRSRLSDLGNARVELVESDNEFVNSIALAGGQFDAIVIDSQPMKNGAYSNSDDFRVACLQSAIPYASRDCIFIVDNTDVLENLSHEVERQFTGRDIHRFVGWVPGIFHPNETTVII